jgi:hypothetical protein
MYEISHLNSGQYIINVLSFPLLNTFFYPSLMFLTIRVFTTKYIICYNANIEAGNIATNLHMQMIVEGIKKSRKYSIDLLYAD